MQDNVHVSIGAPHIENTKCQKLLGININSKLLFEDHINRICKKASAKLNVLSRISYYMDTLKLWLLYIPVELLSSYLDVSQYKELLDKDNSVPIYQDNLQKLALEMFKT